MKATTTYTKNLTVPRPTVLIDPSGLGTVWPGDGQPQPCGGLWNEISCLKRWVSTPETWSEAGINLIKVGYGCFAGGLAGEAAILSPVGAWVALAGPEAVVLLPAAGCVAGAVTAAVEIGIGYEGPSLWP
jgi:hypothetical protein